MRTDQRALQKYLANVETMFQSELRSPEKRTDAYLRVQAAKGVLNHRLEHRPGYQYLAAKSACGVRNMHFVVCWNIKATGAKRKMIYEALRRCLTGYSWVRPLPSFFIIRISSSLDWGTIVEKLKGVAKRYTRQVNFVATPLMQGSEYRGWLPKNTWDKIAMRTKEYG